MILLTQPTPSLTVLSEQASLVLGLMETPSLVRIFPLLERPELQVGPRQVQTWHHLSTCIVPASKVPALLGISHSA